MSRVNMSSPIASRTLAAALALAVCATTGTALAAADAAAEKLRASAMNEDYLALKVDDALKKLEKALAACQKGGCAPALVAQLHRDVGVVLVAGKKDVAKGTEAFTKALQASDAVKLDPDFTTPEITAAFEAARKKAKPAAKPVGGDLNHTPPSTQKVGFPVPLHVTIADTVEGVKRIRIRYRAGTSGSWEGTDLSKHAGGFVFELPCDVVTKAGTVQYYYEAFDSEGEVTASSGSKTEPFSVELAEDADELPPTPGKPEPKTCIKPVTAKPAVEEPKPVTEPVAGKPRKHWLTLQFQQDLLFAPSGEPACTPNKSSPTYECFDGDTSVRKLPGFVEVANPEQPFDGTNTAGKVGGGLSFQSRRLMLGYEYALQPQLTVGGLAGVALGLGPVDKNSVLMLHLEGRATYYFKSLFEPGLKPYAFGGLGLGQMAHSAKTTISAQFTDEAGVTTEETAKVDAWHRTAPVFLSGGGGVLIPIGAPARGPQFGVKLEGRAQLFLPAIDFGLGVGLGGVVGF